ncbi:MAG: hypothetical protein QW279_12220, partial [Candidatus Jordarchaeaceae archaeon]
MRGVKVVPLNEAQNEFAKILENHWSVASPEEIERIKLDIFHPLKNLRQRKKAYEKHQKTILSLKNSFKKLIIAHNKVAKDRGYETHWHYIAKVSSIDEKKQEWFLKNVDSAISKVNSLLPLPKNLPKWYWSEFNIPSALGLVDSKRYLIPNDIYRMARKIVPNLDNLVKRIKLTEKTDFSPSTTFEKETGTVGIKFLIKGRKTYGIYGLLIFVHELGHAISMLKYANKGLDPYQKNKYWHEKEAYKFKFEFENKCLPKKIRYASRGEILNDFLSTLFEYEIYSNPT